MDNRTRKQKEPVLVEVNDYTKNISQAIFSPGKGISRDRTKERGKKSSRVGGASHNSVKVSQLLNSIHKEHKRKDDIRREVQQMKKKLLDLRASME